MNLFKSLIIVAFLCSSSAAMAFDRLVFLKQNSSPKYFAADNSELGLCGEIYQLIGQKLKSKNVPYYVDKNLFPIKRILLNMETGGAHVFCGAGRNAKREKKFVYSKLPVYQVSNVVVANANDDIRIDSLEDLVQKQIATGALFGTTSAAWAKEQGIAIDDSFHDLDTALKVVGLGGKLRLFYYHDLGLNYLVANSPYELEVLPVKFRTTPQWLIYSTHTPPDLINMLDNIVAEITDNGELARIQDRYLLD